MGNIEITRDKSNCKKRLYLSNLSVLYVMLVFMLFTAGSARGAAAPKAPTNLIATAASSRQINLSWTDNATSEISYYVERAPTSTGTWTEIASLGANVTSYSDIGLTQNTTYYYRVRCKSSTTYSSYSNTANATTATLFAPSALTASVTSETSINLSWTNNTTYAINYYVERATAAGGPYTQIASLGMGDTSYADTGLSAGSYYYRIKAYDGINYSTYSNTANGTIITITALAGVGGTISPSGTVWVSYGASQTFTITANSGYRVSDVQVDGASVGTATSYTVTNVTGNHTITASFTINTYTITASANANGAISPNGIVTVNSGATTTFTMTPNTGYSVIDVIVDGSSVGTGSVYTFTNVTENHTISASFADVTPPTVSINPVTTPTTVNSQTISGSMESGATVTISVNTTATVGPISNPTVTAWSCTLTGLAAGANNITVTATDAVGNSATATTSITLVTSLTISNVDSSRHAIDTSASEAASIFFTLNAGPATSTLKIIPEKQGPTGTPVYQTSLACPAAGAYFITWDGHDQTGKVVPDEAYLYILEATDGDNAAAYSPAQPTGAGTVSCTPAASYDPFTNIPLSVSYTLSQPARVNMSVLRGENTFKFVDSVPKVAGTYSIEWDGRDSLGNIIPPIINIGCNASLLRENHIITTGAAPKINGIKTDPFQMTLSYGTLTRIKYDLSVNANVTITVVGPSGGTFILVNNESQAAGNHELEWRAIDTSDATGKKFLISAIGNYTVVVQAVNPASGSSSIARANLIMGY